MSAVVPQAANEQGASSATNLRHTWTDYCGNFIYENDTLKQTLIEGGYISYEYPQNTSVTSISQLTPTYHFYVQDHLGNNRLVVNENGTIEQVNHYYPYGGLMGESKNLSSNQRYKYNGKEFDRMHGLDWYDYGARFHDPATVRWFSVDPLSEDYSEISPYAYCANNPIIHVDKEGKFPLVANVIGAVVGAATDYACQVAANVIVNEGFSTECFTNVDGKSIILSAGAGFISSGASAVGASIGEAVAARTGSQIAGNIAKKTIIEGTKYTANVVANEGNLAKATTDYAVGKAVGAFKRKPVKPTSNKKAVKTAMEKANSEGKKLTAAEKKAIKAQNVLDRKNVGKKNKSIERGNAVKQTTLNAIYYTRKHYDEKRKR